MVTEYTKAWLIKALNDIQVLYNERNIVSQKIITDAICFHAQQAVEKLLKAYLVEKGIEFGKTHNLKILHKFCNDNDSDFQNISVGDLTDYAVEIRYPDDFYIPTIEEADESIRIAETVKIFILKKLSITEVEFKE